jgi:ATP-dependent helicase HepA
VSGAYRLRIGSMVECPGTPGIGRVSEIDGIRVRIDYFESVAEPIAESRWAAVDVCRPVKLDEQTRVYWQNPDTGAWRTGRIVGGDQGTYFVRFPNSEADSKLPEAQLRVRWDLPVHNPVDVLAAGANESGYYSNARLPMMRSLVAQRAACGSAFAFLSSAVDIFPHQVHAAMTVISDPVLRYLLADEVGLGKTIEAGFVLRQVLLDEPMSRVVIIAPDSLRRQWREELVSKFLIDDFPLATVKISAHQTPELWYQYKGYDLVVVDEAHQLAHIDEPTLSPYRELAMLAHSTRRLLLLSATPLTSRVTTHLGLLHLLDPDLYKWTEQEAFERKFRLRKQLANAVFALDADFVPLLPSTIEEIRDLIPDDPHFQKLAKEVLIFLTKDGDLRSEDDQDVLAMRVEALRAHISETYRLHRRMIRHRRLQVTAQDDAVQHYALVGRAQPVHIELDTERQQLVQEALLDWQTGIANWLIDEGREKEAARIYGPALGVLVSRADSASSDLADALRWRLHMDTQAAIRAGLNDSERTMLSAPLIAPHESYILDQLDSELNSRRELTRLAEVLKPILDEHKKVVVFCGAGVLATRLAETLEGESPKRRVSAHTQQAGAEACDIAVTTWRTNGGILVADDSAEDGLNLQVADAVVHCRLPWSPNRLEQRIGRVDRYLGGIQGQPPRQYAVTSTDCEYLLPGAWLGLLDQGFGIFSQSVSALQDTIDEGLADIWATATLDGPEGLSRLIEKVSEDLKRERREIDSMDMLDSIHDARTGVVDIAAAIGELELRWRSIGAATVGFATGETGGLRFRKYDVGPGGQFTQFERGNSDPFVPPRILAKGGTRLTPAMMRGAFDRTAALKVLGTRVLRSGNPFIDLLARTVWIDDRGQATVSLRRDPHADGATVYFGFDFLVEANIDDALCRVRDDEIGRNALRRQADCLLAPFTRRVWVQAATKTAIDHLGQLDWLNRPYKPVLDRGNDINLNAQRIGPLLDLFGGRGRFEGAARFAENIAKSELQRVTDLTARCDEARKQATASLVVRRVQAEARQAAGRIVSDTESYATDIGIADALVAGLSAPRVKVVSVICLVRGSLPGVDRG